MLFDKKSSEGELEIRPVSSQGRSNNINGSSKKQVHEIKFEQERPVTAPSSSAKAVSPTGLPKLLPKNNSKKVVASKTPKKEIYIAGKTKNKNLINKKFSV